MIPTLLFAAATLAPGLPAALVLRRRSADELRWGDVLVEGLVLGLAWWLVLGLVVATVGDLGAVTLLVPTAVAVGVGIAAALPTLRTLRRPNVTWVGVATVVVLLIAIWLRRRPFYLLYQTSDMSEYIRAGNALADGGGFSGWFVRLFQVPLALSSVTFGRDDVVAVLPFLGLAVAVLAASLAARVTVPVVGLAVLALLAADPVAVWFSRFPASETLYAALLLGSVLFLFLAVHRRRMPEAVIAGALQGLLLLTRGNGVILAPIVLAAVALCALLLRPKPFRIVVVFGLAAIGSLYAGFVYNSATQKAYFIGDQLVHFVPARVFPYVDSLDRPVEAVLWGVAVAGGALVWSAACLVVNRRFGGTHPWRRWVLPAVGAVVVLALVALPVGVLVDSLGRLGLVLLALAIAGAVLAVVRVLDLPDSTRAVVVVCVLLAGAFAVFQVDRLGHERQAPYYLYWDRYFFSEVVPALAVLSAFAIDALRRVLPPKVAVAGLTVVALLGGGQAWAAGAEAREHQLFERSYEQLTAVADLVDDPRAPVVYSGLPTEELPDGWFPEWTANTYRVVATPLQETFGVPVVNQLESPSQPDPVVDEATVAQLLPEGGYLLQVQRPGDLDVGELVGTAPLHVAVLDRQPDPDDEQWRMFDLVLEVRRVAA